MIDVDHFKTVNDDYGHAVGDRALHAIAETLRDNTRVFDSLARYGGEEFVVVMPGTGCDDAAIAARAAARRRRRAGLRAGAQPALPPDHQHRHRLHRGHAMTPEALLRAADLALYEREAERPQPGGDGVLPDRVT